MVTLLYKNGTVDLPIGSKFIKRFWYTFDSTLIELEIIDVKNDFMKIKEDRGRYDKINWVKTDNYNIEEITHIGDGKPNKSLLEKLIDFHL